MSIQKFDLEFVEARDLSSSVRHFTFKPTLADGLVFQAGQFISLHINQADTVLRRNYSIANPPGGPLVEIACSYIKNGLASTLLWGLQPGDKIPASGPYGRLVLGKTAPKRYLLISTGTGVTPYRAMMPELQQLLPEHEVVLLQGVRTPEELLYAPEFRSIASQHPSFKFIACYSRATPGADEADAVPGYVQDQLAELTPAAGSDVAMLCGNPNMVDGAFEMLKSLGLPASDIKREKYISSK